MFQSFFGRTYNNLSSISDCKNNGECVINKKNRTACKACRLRKCLLVGMSKSGSRYGRRSNWFKIHCLLQEQHQHKGSSLPSGLPTSLSAQPNNFIQHNFLTSLCNSSRKRDQNNDRSPSDSGASSADLEESNRDGSIESFSVESKTEMSSVSSPPVFENYRSSYSPFHNGRSVPTFHSMPISTVIFATNTPTPPVSQSSTHEQEEPIDLSFNPRKRRLSRSVSPKLRTPFEIHKPTPLDLTLVRSEALSG